VRFLENFVVSAPADSDQSGNATLNVYVNMAETKRGKTYHFYPEWEEGYLFPISKDMPRNRQLFLDQLVSASLPSRTWKSWSPRRLQINNDWKPPRRLPTPCNQLLHSWLREASLHLPVL